MATTDPQSPAAPYDIAEALADAADPCLPDGTRSSVFGMLHAGETHIALSDLVNAIAGAHYPIPTDVLTAVRQYVDHSFASSSPGQWGYEMTVAMHRRLQTIPDTGQIVGTIGSYGDYHLSFFILQDAGLSDDSPRDQQVAAIGAWLADNKPGWALRYSLAFDGFADLLLDQ